MPKGSPLSKRVSLIGSAWHGRAVFLWSGAQQTRPSSPARALHARRKRPSDALRLCLAASCYQLRLMRTTAPRPPAPA